MNEGLEALERIGKTKYQTTVADIAGFERITVSVKQDNKKDYNIVKDELKEYNDVKEVLVDYGLTLANLREACLLLAQWKSAGLCWANYEKQKKALEIIKNKQVNMFGLLIAINEGHKEMYNNNYHKDVVEKLTQEEYDLLKEVLQWIKA